MAFQQDYRKTERKIKEGKKYVAVRLEVTFYRHRAKNPTHATIYCRVTLDGERAESSMAIGCLFDAFEPNTATIANDPINTGRLTDFKARVFKIFAEREITERKSTPLQLIEIAHGLRQHDNDRLTAIQAANHWMTQKEALLGFTIKESTLQSYRRKHDIVVQFLTEIHHKNIMVDDLKPITGTQFHNYCLSSVGLDINSTVKVVRLLKSIFNYAFENEWCDRNPLLTYTAKAKKKPVIALTSEELHKIMALQLIDSGMARVRDAFVFQCVTGLAYADLAALSHRHIVEHRGIKCIEKPRQKTGELAVIPLLPIARTLIDQYKTDRECLLKNKLMPVLTNQKMNAYLKSIGEMAGVKTKLNTHLGRKTFATYLRDNGISNETIASVLGHAKSRVTEMFYIQAKTETVLKDFSATFNFQPN